MRMKTKMKQNSVYITAYSMTSALGYNAEESLASLKKEKQVFSQDIKNNFQYPHFSLNKFNGDNKYIKSSKICMLLLDNIKNDFKHLSNIPLFLATSTGGIRETEEVYNSICNDEVKYPLFERHFFNKVINDIKENYDNFGECFTFSTACSSSGHGILHAYKFIKAGIIDKAIILGYDTLSWTTMVGFDSLKLISHTGTKPLTKNRDGLSLGDGGGVILLESNPSKEPVAEIVGISSNSDGYHISSPDPEGGAQRKCILSAIKEAGIPKEKIDYISAHGTGTFMNDEVEINTVKSIFEHNITISSLKSFIGHTLGASAITELALSILMLKNKTIYQPDNLSEPIDENMIPARTINKEVQYFLKNSFGFGGNNVSMVCKII